MSDRELTLQTLLNWATVISEVRQTDGGVVVTFLCGDDLDEYTVEGAHVLDCMVQMNEMASLAGSRPHTREPDA